MTSGPGADSPDSPLVRLYDAPGYGQPHATPARGRAFLAWSVR